VLDWVATGTGKTFTMAQMIEETSALRIILPLTQTLAGTALYGEFKGFSIPDNAVIEYLSSSIMTIISRKPYLPL